MSNHEWTRIFTKGETFVIPSEVEESLIFEEQSPKARDLSTALHFVPLRSR